MSLSIIHGPRITISTASPTLFGMKESDCTWICVTAWKRLTARPITRPTSRIGPATSKASVIACVARFTTVSWFIALLLRGLASVEARDQRARDQVPAVDQDEQQDLEGHGDECRWEHDHAHTHQGRADYEVDDQERQEDQKPDLECRLHLAHDESRDQHIGRDLTLGAGFRDLRQVHEQ